MNDRKKPARRASSSRRSTAILPNSKSVELPPWDIGTDRQRGRALFRMLRGRGMAPALQRRDGRLLPVVEFRKNGFPKIYALCVHRSARDINASLVTALSLAARGEFVAAGAIYHSVMSRQFSDGQLQNQVKISRYRRQVGALKARHERAKRAILSARDVMIFAISRPNWSADRIARRIGKSPSTVRRILAKYKDL